MSDSIDRSARAPVLGRPTPPLGGPADQASALRGGVVAGQPPKRERDEAADFENFLNQTSTTVVEKPRKDRPSDAADLISNNSVYLPPTAFPS